MHAAERDPELFYNEHLPLLVALALSNDVSEKEAEQLAHEILLSSLRNLSMISNIKAWLVGALRAAIANRRAGA